MEQALRGELERASIPVRAHRRLSTADWIVAGTALFIIGNSVSICIGWWARIPLLVQFFPDAPTHFNTALIFILLAVGELGLVLRRRSVVMAVAVVVTCLAGAELAEYALGQNLGIDTLFAVPFVGLDAPYPGRMSGNTIACFLLVCAAQVLMARPERDAGAATAAAVVLKTLAGGIAFLALLGYLVGLKSAYGWTQAVGMSIRSCAGFLLIFIAGIAALWQRDMVDKPSLPSWFLPFLTIAVVSISTGLIWIFSSPLARPFMLDPVYGKVAHRRSIAMLLSVGTLIVLGTISVLVARHKAVMAWVNEKKLSSVLQHMSEGVMLIDARGNAFYQNPASRRIHGFDPNATGSIRTQDLPVSWEGWDEQGRALNLDEWPLSRVARGERVQNQVLRARRRETQHEFFASYNGSAIYDDNGKVALSFITIQDITERRQAESELRESEERFRTMANAIPQLAWMARADGFLFWYNQRWHDYTGTTPQQMEGWGWQSVHDPAVLPTVLRKWRDAIALAQPFEMEFPLRGTDGTFRNFLTRGQPMNDSQGRLVQWFGTCTDVDQLKRVEQSLRLTKARLKSTLEASSVGTWTWDLASDRLIADQFTARMFSLDGSAAAAGLPVAAYLQVLHEDDRTEVADALGRAIELCGAYDIEYRVRQSGGVFRWLQARGRVESDGAGHAVLFHGAVIDITDRKISELSLRDNNEQLKRSNRDLEEFAYIASHDLKTPLHGIKSAALWLEQDLHDLSDESRTLLELMQSRINRMEKLLDDLLTYSRVGRTETAAGETNLGDIFASIVEVLNPPAHMRVRAEGDLSVRVTASAQLEQVLRNLINNAIKHHDKPNGEVVLSAMRAGDFVDFVVRDDGPGILPQFHDKIFQLFQTLKRRDDVEGSGMGLALVKKLVEQQNCRISVDSLGNGAGAVFRFQWPALPIADDNQKIAHA
ncbi:MAG: PAS domain S-box protein [Steroidobacteraceae bacterium]|jgi:PAS domain S-box-containing protein